MKYGLTETTVKKICAVFARFPEIEKAVLYGSRAKGNFKTGSDIDLMLYGESIAPDQLSAITSALDDLLLPYTIDLAIFDDLSHAKLREHIERVGVVFYERATQDAAVKKGWEIKRLGEVIKLEYGKPLPDDKRISKGKYPVYGANGEKDRTDEFYYDRPSIIVGRKGSAGEINLTEKRFWPLDVTYFVTFDDKKYSLGFLYNLLLTLNLPKLAKGVKPGINRNEVYEIGVNIPPLPEQKRIVAILDKAFEAISTAKQNAEKNLQNAREIFESYLHSVFANPGNDWEEKVLNEICDVRDGTHDSPKYIKEGIPFVTQKNIRTEGLSFANTKFITEEDHNKFYKRSNVAFGDILISMIGANRGMACIVDDKRIFSIKNVGLIKASERINNHYLLYYLKSPLAMRYVKYMSNGGAQEFVGLTALRSFPIPYPKLSEQNSIIAKLDTLAAETKKLEAIYWQKLADLDELKKSILHQAFNGAL